MIFWHLGTTLAIVWFVMRGNTRVDYRLVALGALLPDLIDKPLGRILLRSQFESGRIFGHTLLLNVAVFSLLFFMRGRFKRKATLVPIGSLLHLAEDAMWATPVTFWWPLFGTTFPPDPTTDGALAWLNPLNSPAAMIQEPIGLGLLLWLLAAHGMLSRDGLRTFLRTGHLEPAKTP